MQTTMQMMASKKALSRKNLCKQRMNPTRIPPASKLWELMTVRLSARLCTSSRNNCTACSRISTVRQC
ncbi:MAG: hypothetical protein ACLR1R_02910 [Ruminococcus callidus]